MDNFHPRWIAVLPTDWKERFIDILMMWEARPVKPKSWLRFFVVGPKPDGGDRTIGLSVCPLRVWSMLRRPYAVKW